MKTNFDANSRLKEFEIRPSLHRMAILDYLMKNPVHPTVDMIFNDLYPSIPTLSKTTVYNTLKLFTEQGAAQAISIDEKNVRYDADISAHAHFKCKTCGAIYDLPLEENDFSTKVKNDAGLLLMEYQVYYKGYCNKCKNQF